MIDVGLKEDLLLHFPQFKEAYLGFKYWEVRLKVQYFDFICVFFIFISDFFLFRLKVCPS